MTINSTHASKIHTRTQKSEYVQPEADSQVSEMKQAMNMVSQSQVIPEFNRNMIVKSIDILIYDLETLRADETFVNEQYRDIEINDLVEVYNNQISMITAKWGELS